jgi:hypothetical protein
MTKQSMWRQFISKSIAFRNPGAAALCLMFVLVGVGLTQAQDRDDYGYYRGGLRQAHEYGYQQGYSDGTRHGRHDCGHRYEFRSEDWEHASRGYSSWMGPLGIYRDGYRDGYKRAYDIAFRQAGWRGDDDGYRRYERYRDSDDWGGFRRGRQVAFDFGFQDGSSVAREDLRRGKPYNSNPRGKYEDRDAGYRREFGDRNAYRAEYSRGYSEGYERVAQRW